RDHTDDSNRPWRAIRLNNLSEHGPFTTRHRNLPFAASRSLDLEFEAHCVDDLDRHSIEQNRLICALHHLPFQLTRATGEHIAAGYYFSRFYIALDIDGHFDLERAGGDWSPERVGRMRTRQCRSGIER